MSDDYSYDVGQTALCYHGPMLYEAKILKKKIFLKDSPTEFKGVHYFVHYKGWKNTWDEWVDHERMRRMEEPWLSLRRDLDIQHNPPKDKESEREPLRERKQSSHHRRESSAKEPAAVKDTKSSKREKPPKKAVKEEEGYESEALNWASLQNRKRSEIKIPIPENLKSFLIDDWEAVTKNGQLVTLPKDICVDTILLEFRDHILGMAASSAPKDREESLPSFLVGIKAYFEKSLGANLLYRFERPQYADLLRRFSLGPNVPPEHVRTNCQIYGAEHLLRLLSLLPGILTSLEMEPDSVAIIKEYGTALLEFLARGQNRYFQRDYEDTSPLYLSYARA